MKRSLIVILILTGILSWNCSRTIDKPSLKQSFEAGTAKINEALPVISQTKGFDLMSLSGDLNKSAEDYHDSITLDLIAGIYDFMPDTFICYRYMKPFWTFKKTGESDKMIVNLPQRMMFHPRYLLNVTPPDTVPVNDFTITASDYHFYYSFWNRYDYSLSAGLTLKSEDIGTLDVKAAGASFADQSYSSAFAFTDDYSILVTSEKGDTSVRSFALMEGDKALLKETSVFIWKDFRMGEKVYTVSVGNIDIVRTTGIDSIQVFLDGTLQKTAAAKITDVDGDDGSICHHRDILLTFDDGTTAKLSELIGPAREILKTLVDSMHSMYFAKHVVDYIALNIYYQPYFMRH
ncbi:MAG TPA: hypothetical protein VMV74_12005 [Bacteroidales bacterium]|nr:hypothetical protein [Bacteroidales bacterium]